MATLKTELTLSALLTQRCVEFSNSPKAVEIIDSGIEKMFKELVNDAFRSYSDFGKSMTEAFKAALPTNVESIVELERYNSLVVRLVKEKWATAGIESKIVEQMTELVSEFTSEKTIPKFIMASDFWKAFIEDQQEKAAEEQWSVPQVFVEESDYADGYLRVGLHPEPSESGRYSSSSKNSYHQCDFTFAFSPQSDGHGRNKKAIKHEGHQVYELYAGQLDNGVLGKKIIKAYSQFDKLVMALYYGGSFFVWDESPEDISYPGYDS